MVYILFRDYVKIFYCINIRICFGLGKKALSINSR